MSEDTDSEEENELDSQPLEDEVTVDSVINKFVHRVLDIEDCSTQFISLAIEQYKKNAERLNSELAECQKLLDSEDDAEHRRIGMRKFRQCDREIDRHNNSMPMEILEKSLFISLFSAFDKFVGDLITVIYSLNTDLYKNINREIQLSEALTFSSIEELREVMLDKEIETLRRKSYAEQFGDLEKRFSLSLTKFDDWPTFIEMSQRRNLFTHCDGIISKQYIDVCKSSGYKFESNLEVGEQLGIGTEYFFHSCYVVVEVAVMLGQTLWRKTCPKDLEKPDSSLNELIFDFLHIEDWPKSISLCKFALNLPNVSNEQMERILSINYAIALKALGEESAAKKVLDKKDWSASSYDFKLAYSILCEEFTESGRLMRLIGEEGELITEMAYHDWPLFREFRERTEFFESYELVYGYKYSSKISSIAEEKENEVAKL